MTPKGMKRAWQALRGAGFKLNSGVEETFDHWIECFDGVSDKGILMGVKLYIDHEAGVCKTHRHTQYQTRMLKHKAWPMASIVGRFVPEEHQRKPPTIDDLSIGKWWPPTGSPSTAEEWAWRSAYETERQKHRDNPCYSSWLAHTREMVMFVRVYMRWDPDWPVPWVMGKRELTKHSCGIQCSLACSGTPPNPEVKANTLAIEGVGDDLDRHYRLVDHNFERWGY